MSETGVEMVRRVAGECEVPPPDDEEAGYILWEETAFPMADAEHVEAQVREYLSTVGATDDE